MTNKRELFIWKRGVESAHALAEISASIPASEKYGMVSHAGQMSISENKIEKQFFGQRKN